MSHAETRNQRLDQVEYILLTSRLPLSKAELARRCNVHRATIGDLEEDLFKRGVPLRYDERGRWYIDRNAYLTSIKLRRDEAVAVYLAARLLGRYSDKPNEHIIVALEKLAATLSFVAPPLGQHIGSTTQVLRADLPAVASHHQRTLEVLGQAWAEGVMVDMVYRPLRSNATFRHTFAPYFLEPSAIGFGTYAIGYADPPGKIRTRKLERIERITITDKPFTVPADFDPVRLLAGAWGIWFDAEDQPTIVKLRFSPDVARRVQETRWHPSQYTQDDGQGGLIWTAQIDEPQEIMPWLRGWGADCEVLEPNGLRTLLVGEVRRLMRTYRIEGTLPDDRQQRFNDIFG